MPPQRDRTGRQQKFNQIGEIGRITGIAPPHNVPRDSGGNELPSAFFNDADHHASQRPSAAAAAAAASSRPSGGPSSQKKVNGGSSQGANGSRPSASANDGAAGGARGRQRPDLFAEVGERGRKTGVQPPPVERDANGFEAVGNFFPPSSSPAKKKTTTAVGGAGGSSVRIHGSAARGLDAYGGGGSDAEGGETVDASDMEIDQGSSLTPSTFRAKANAHQSNNNNGVMSLQRLATTNARGSSATAGNAKGKARRISPSPLTRGEDDEQEEEEEERDDIQRVVVGTSGRKKGGRLSMLAPKRKDTNVVLAADSDDEEEEEEEGDEDDIVVFGANAADDDDDDDDDEEEIATAANARGGNLAKPFRKSAANGRTPASAQSASTRRASSGSPSKGTKTVGGSGSGSAKGKGKAKRAPTPEEEEEVEENFDFGDFGGGDEEVEKEEEQEAVDEEEEEEEETPRGKKGAGAGKGKKAATTAAKGKGKEKVVAPKKKKANAPIASGSGSHNKRTRDEGSADEEGVRRSTRQRLSPLDYWRNERVIYKRRPSGVGINAVVRIPKPQPESLTTVGRKKHGGAAAAARRAAGGSRVKSEAPEEDGVDDMTDPDGLVWSWEGGAETTRRIAFTAKMMDPRPTYNHKFMFQKIFTELDYLAGGILQIPAGAEKPSKPAKDNSYMFYCIEGAVSAVVHRTRFAIGPGGAFFVPRGNSYSITATSNRDVKLFFTQGRRVVEYPDGTAMADEEAAPAWRDDERAQEDDDEEPEEEEQAEEEEEE